MNREAFLRSIVWASSIHLHSPSSHRTSASRKAAVRLRRREEVIFYIRAVNHSSLSVFFLWWFGSRSGWQGAPGGMCYGAGASDEGLTRRLGRGGYWFITQPRGCLFKLKSCLDCSTQTLLLYCSCMGHKELEIAWTEREWQR